MCQNIAVSNLDTRFLFGSHAPAKLEKYNCPLKTPTESPPARVLMFVALKTVSEPTAHAPGIWPNVRAADAGRSDAGSTRPKRPGRALHPPLVTHELRGSGKTELAAETRFRVPGALFTALAPVFLVRWAVPQVPPTALPTAGLEVAFPSR